MLLLLYYKNVVSYTLFANKKILTKKINLKCYAKGLLSPVVMTADVNKDGTNTMLNVHAAN